MNYKQILLCFLSSFLFAILLLSSAHAKNKSTLEIGYMPILPVSQLFVKLEDGSFNKLNITPKLVKFQNGPAMAQALLSGQLDVAYIGIGPAMVARAKGAKIKVVAANIIEQISFIAHGELAQYFKDGDPRTAFTRFAKDKGRIASIATFPRGSVPYTVLQYWLSQVLEVDPKSLHIVPQGAALVQQSLLTKAVDGAAILEPIVSAVKAKVKDIEVVARGNAMFPDQPGAVLVVRESLIEQHPELVATLVAAHKKATETLNRTPLKAAVYVKKYVGGGRLPQSIVNSSLQNSVGNFVADPNKIIEGSRKLRDFQRKTGTLKVEVDLGVLFEPKFCNKLKK